MKKEMKREPLNVTIDKEVLKKFNQFCKTNLINRSRQTEELIKKFLEGKKK